MAGGLRDAIRDLYRSSALKGIDLKIFSYRDVHAVDDLAGWHPLKVLLYKKLPFFYSYSISKDLIASESTLLHVHGLWRYPHLFIRFWKNASNKVIVSPHGMFDPYILAHQSKVKRAIGNLMFSKIDFHLVDCYHALSLKELEDIRSYGITSPVAIIPNGININEENFVRNTKKESKRLLFLARLHPKKGVDILLKAVGDIKQNNPDLLNNWGIDIVGWGQDNYPKKLRVLADELGLQDLVKFHGGVFDAAKDELYKKSDAYILPSHGEGLPMTVLEAWSWKLPVIITQNCNLPEGFEAGAAIEIEASIQSVVEGLTKLFKMSDVQRSEMGLRGKALVEKDFTWEVSGKKMSELYRYVTYGGDVPHFVNLMDPQGSSNSIHV
ncbi:glycosyltransferase [Pedobacter deserti]|uniref:glycosyltransferase n=1 Tax=Pedobacter deserti TaxID=2817382 RepID=UPI002109C1D7|nr:glycosyltransferase [Pedobacter sp. SYSU D00382]